MPGVKNCLTCRWEGDWWESGRRNAHLAGYCTYCPDEPETLPLGMRVEYTDALYMRYSDKPGKVFVFKNDEEIINCPAWQPKDQTNTPAREAGGE